MAEITLESLGLTKDEIVARLVEHLAERLLGEWAADDAEGPSKTRFAKVLERATLARVTTAIETIAGQHVLPNVAAYVETLTLQRTNEWGEKVSKPMTFIEYLVERAEAYLREQVDYDGKARSHDTFVWRPAGTRIAWMVDKHLQYSIQTAMEQALKTANSAIVGGLEQAVKIKLAEVAASLKVTTKVG